MSEFGRWMRTATLLGATLLFSLPAWAQAATNSNEGPGRITCSAANKCALGIGTPPSLRFTIDVAALPDADKARLAKCTAKAPACIATVTGVEAAKGMSMKASAIKWFN